MQALVIKGVVGNALRAAIVILEHSLALDLEAARFDRQSDLAAMLLGMDEGLCSAAVRELEDRQIVRTYRHAGSWWYEFLPIEGWAPAIGRKRETKPGAETLARTTWKTAVEHARSDPRQKELIAWKPTEQGDGGLTAAMQQGASEKLSITQLESAAEGGVSEKVEYNSTFHERGSPEKLSITQLADPATAARVRTRAHHDHVPTTVPMLHDHEHGRGGVEEGDGALRRLSNNELESQLDDESRFWLSQLAELFGADEAAKYRRTWILRFCDRWKVQAYEALGETKRKKIQGERFIKGPGYFANWAFQGYKQKAKRGAQTA